MTFTLWFVRRIIMPNKSKNLRVSIIKHTTMRSKYLGLLTSLVASFTRGGHRTKVEDTGLRWRTYTWTKECRGNTSLTVGPSSALSSYTLLWTADRCSRATCDGIGPSRVLLLMFMLLNFLQLLLILFFPMILLGATMLHDIYCGSIGPTKATGISSLEYEMVGLIIHHKRQRSLYTRIP